VKLTDEKNEKMGNGISLKEHNEEKSNNDNTKCCKNN
jgi:hypothetical protein